MRAGIVAIFFFAALLALGHYVAAPFFCRGGIVIPTLDPRALCGADLHLNRSGSMLLYFAAIAAALVLGVIAGVIPARAKKTAEAKPEAKHAETFEQIVAVEEKKLQQPDAAPVAHPSAAAPSSPAAEPKPVSVVEASNDDKPVQVQKKPEAPAAEPATVAAAEAITVGLAVTKNAARGGFDGTNQELVERFRELRKQEGVNSIAQAQRLLDESTLNALGKGIDPKQHLSDIAHLVLSEDPDLKSGVVRGVVVHIAARLKELGVVQKIPSPAKPAA